MGKIVLANTDPIVGFAATELCGYLTEMTAKMNKEDWSIRLGLFGDLGVEPWYKVEAVALDDAIYVDVENGHGMIAGSNPRSVLIGVYRFLYALGCRWVRPGKNGEILPPTDLSCVTVRLKEKAASRHRVICIEGAPSLENALDMIAWMPKAGFNGFFMQFREGYAFFDQWYSHENDPVKKRGEPLAVETAREFTRHIERELARRGLLYHAVGHGWQMEAYGIPGLGWMEREGTYPQEYLDKLAVLDGKRLLRYGKPMLTALCYSDPDVRERIARCVADYAEDHRNVDYLHVWLDDGYNNKCECVRCAGARPSDAYFRILNAIDAELTRRGIGTRIVFLAYQDLLWRPLIEKLGDTGRFVFMYANCREDYCKSLSSQGAADLPPYVQNKINMDMDNGLVAGFLLEWTGFIRLDGFLFEYYHFGLKNILRRARVIREDIGKLSEFGLNGLVNCQSLRSFFPCGIGMAVMGGALWNSGIDFNDAVTDYFVSSFGTDALRCLGFLENMEAAQRAAETAPGGISGMREIIRGFCPIADKNLCNEEPCHRLSWIAMRRYVEIMDMYADLLEARAAENGLERKYEIRIKDFLIGIEEELQPMMEPWLLMKELFG